MQLGIKSKLILSLMLANGLLAGLMYGLTSQSFDRGFLAYVNQAEMQKLQPLLDDLSQYYQDKSGWRWIRQDHYLWRDLMNKHVFGQTEGKTQSENSAESFQRRQRPSDGGWQPEQRRARSDRGFRPPLLAALRSGRLNIDPRVLLRDQYKKLILGKHADSENVQWLPIKVNNVLVGELGVKSLNNLSAKLDVLFVEQQKETYAYIAVALLLATFVVAIVLARYFLGPIRLIKQGVHRLVAGDYEQKFELKSGDELGQLARDFNFLTRTLKGNRQSRQQWIADISHELRTPVAILQGELDALLDGVRKVDRNALTSLQQESRRLGSLINDLHELSLSDLGALSYNKENLDLVELIEDFIDSHERHIEKYNIQVSFNSPNEACMILADGDRLDQCFKNLLQNTLRYTDQPGQLEIRLVHGKQGIELYWEDSSPGVSDEELKHLFDRLYRVEQSRNRAKGGAGLGMSICKNIIQAHDAEVSLYKSKLGGLGVRINFPV
ncbi:MAG: ATP-binding protein [Gammaproteobacteria bacterium]